MSEESTTLGQTPGQSQGKWKAVKHPWTAARCLKRAKRFEDVESWSQNHPSSYKAAVSHGWLAECTAHMTKGGVTSINKQQASSSKGKKLPKSA